MKTVVDKDGQIVIPEAVRKKLNITPGTVLEIWEENGCMIAEKMNQNDPIDQVRGCLQQDSATDEFIKQVRGDA